MSHTNSLPPQDDLLEEYKLLTEEHERLRRAHESLVQTNGTLEEENESLHSQIRELRRQLFGRKSERHASPEDAVVNGMRQSFLFEEDQLSKEAIEEIEEEISKPKEEPKEEEERETITYERKKPKKQGPKPLPDHLPREDRVIDIADKTCVHGHDRVQVGERVVEELEYIPAQMKVIRYIYPIYSAKECCFAGCGEPLSADPLPRPIDEARAGPGLLSHIAVSKYGDHCPLYRQSQIFAREGIDICRSTLCEWIIRTALLLSPIVGEMKRQLLARSFLQADETTLRVLRAGQGKKKERAHKAYLWAYGIPWGEVVYDFCLGRDQEHPGKFLKGFQGALQIDGYDGYNLVFDGGTVVRLGCFAHVRRQFHKALQTATSKAKTVLAAFQILYRIEREIKAQGLSPVERVKVRKEKAEPILKSLETLLTAYQGYCRPKSDLGKAITYALNEWKYLKRYVDYGEAEIDNNSIEHTMRPVAIGRKNYLFAGSPEGGNAAATLYSLITSCKRLDVNLYEYLKDVLSRISTHPAAEIHRLTPRGWRDEQRQRAVNEDS